MEEYTELHELIESAEIGLSKELDQKDFEEYSKKLSYYVLEIANLRIKEKLSADKAL